MILALRPVDVCAGAQYRYNLLVFLAAIAITAAFSVSRSNFLRRRFPLGCRVK
jgi:hypothetical protein